MRAGAGSMALVASFALLGLGALLLAPQGAQAVTISPGSSTADLVKQICASAPKSAKLCWPLSTSHYVQCSTGKVLKCPSGKLYDYAKRSCRSPRLAATCPNFMCPSSTPTYNLTLGQPPLSRPYGKFGEFGNYTIDFNSTGKYVIFCPVSGHCESGMSITVNVYDGKPRGPSFVEVDDFEEPMKNTDLYPKKYKDIELPVGGKININWDEPIHFVAILNATDGISVPYVPYAPQPTYKCLDWKVVNGTIPPAPGETRLVNFGQGQNYTWTASEVGTQFFVCPLGTHCRMGQVFKVTTKAAPMDYKPSVQTVPWTLTGENYPDLTVYVGDTLFFKFIGVHALSTIKSLSKYSY